MLCQLRTLSNMSEKLKTDFSIAAIIGNDVPAEKRKPEAYDLNGKSFFYSSMNIMAFIQETSLWLTPFLF